MRSALLNIMKTALILAGIATAGLLPVATFQVSAQIKTVMPSGKDRYKEVSGRYGGSDGVCLFDDGRFMLYGYATVVFGSYGFEKDYILFYPDKPEHFEVYAWKNKSIGDSTRIYFQGFEEGTTFVQFDKQQVKRVFNEDVNCFNAPYILTEGKVPADITLFEKADAEDSYTNKPVTAWQYSIDKSYNDFIFLYNKPHRYYNSFSGRIEQVEKDVEVLRLSANFGDRKLGKHPAADEDNDWQEILQWKEGYDQSKVHKDEMYANRMYNIFPWPDSLNYKYDAALNQYVDILNKDNDSYFRDNAYNDDRYLSKYTRLLPQKKDNPTSMPEGIAAAPVFYTVCGDE